MLLVIMTLMMILMRLTMIGDTWVDQAECWKELVAVRDLRDAFGILDQRHCPSCWWSRPGLVNSILLVLVTLVTNLSTSSPSEPHEETSWCFRPSITCGPWRWLRSGDFEKTATCPFLGKMSHSPGELRMNSIAIVLPCASAIPSAHFLVRYVKCDQTKTFLGEVHIPNLTWDLVMSSSCCEHLGPDSSTPGSSGQVHGPPPSCKGGKLVDHKMITPCHPPHMNNFLMLW